MLPVAGAVCPKAGDEPKLKALVDVPNEGVVEAPKAGALLTPNAVVLEDPKLGVVFEPNGVEPNAGVLEAPNKDVDVEPNAGVAVAPNDGVVVVPKAGVVVAPKVLLPNVGCVCWNVLPKGLDWLGDDPKPPKLGFCPNKEPLPKLEDAAPNAGVGDAPKAGVELPNGEDDGVPNAGVDGWPKPPVDAAPNAGVDVAPKAGADVWPKGLVEAAPNGEAVPVCAPKAGVGLPKGLLAGALVWPNADWAPNGLLDVCPNALPDDCPNGLVEPNMAARMASHDRSPA